MPEQSHIETEDPDVARDEIEKLRARMSSTLDQIEDVIVSKKEKIRADLDVGARIRGKPLHAAGIVFATALILGFLSGGSRKESRLRKEYGARALHWENRARKLLAIAREQEEEIDELADNGGVANARTEPDLSDEDDWEDDIDVDDDDDDYEDGDDFEDDDLESDDSDDDVAAFEDDPESEETPSRFSGLKQAVTERVAEFVSETTRSLLDGIRERR